jgi:DNA-binding transcriptional LysR family regulator
MDTRHVRAAVAVARHGSFTKAAAELFMAQSTVSRQICSLERELGKPLFIRGLRAVELTAEGQAFMPEAHRLLEAVARATEAARSASRKSA